MGLKSKINRYIVTSILVAGMCAILAVIFYAQSGQLRIVKLNYDENASVGYKVYLNNNNYYDKEYLEEGMQYISGIIRSVDIKYDYNIDYSDKLDSTVINTVNAKVKVVDVTNNEKIIYENEEELKNDKQTKKNTDKLTVDQTISIDYQKYNNFANEFKSKYGIPADCKLIVTFTTSQKNSTGTIEDITRSKVMTVEIPLSEQMITINKSSDSNEKSAYIATTAKTFANHAMFVAAIALFVGTAIFAALAVYFIIKKTKLTSEYDRRINKLLKQYDAYITESTNIIGLKPDAIFVKSFKELLDVRNNIEKAIVYNKVTDDISRFIIVDGKQEYCYEISREEFK
ncbi:MAG: DUF5305 domain-containing protein [Bacilli bacterium]|nr:DUF5305 domain-containing protein [Bacilli bacterium]